MTSVILLKMLRRKHNNKRVATSYKRNHKTVNVVMSFLSENGDFRKRSLNWRNLKRRFFVFIGTGNIIKTDGVM